MSRVAVSLSARTQGPLRGAVSVPGDKSMSHRALMLGAIARGETYITGLLEGDDVLRTAAAMRALGAEVEREPNGTWYVTGMGGKTCHQEPLRLYFGNAGTGVRLAMGLLAGLGQSASLNGDESLRARPMGRITEPLTAMGVSFPDGAERLPIKISKSNTLRSMNYTLPVPSAQVKSAILMAALGANGETTVIEPIPTRDHTENMLRAFGVDIQRSEQGGAQQVSLTGPQTLTGCALTIPGDPSSAAFLVAAALIVPGSDVTISQVMMNPHRTGFLDVVREMGGQVDIINKREAGGEDIADIQVRHSALRGIEVPAARAASMIDEYPVLCAVAACADGVTRMEGLAELRVKESDRIAACEAGLKANGVPVVSGPDWLEVTGQPGEVSGGGNVATHHDHRIAMTFLVLSLVSKTSITIDDDRMIATSFPEFQSLMTQLGAEFASN